ncbi:PAS domain S-box protein [Sutcliffiella deserti]|uniref:PAS domain S-box protein n=1 Tax=Sutcliffiella deserti TaxID=2875501 RepID=UPI001CC10EDC|nr:PAS domain S-box protein [Sutcliffiella deserti]
MEQTTKKHDTSLTILEKEDMYRQIVEYSYETTIIHANHKVLYINQSGAGFFGGDKENIIGGNPVEIFPTEYQGYIIERIRKAYEDNIIGELIEIEVVKLDGSVVDVELFCHPVQFGNQKAIQSIIRDISSRKEAERKLATLMNEVATTIVPVSEGVSVFPLVGSMDEERASHLLDIIPQKIQGHNLHHLIIDVSGTFNVNEVVIEFLYNINSIMKLLGVNTIYTGLRPEFARKAVNTCTGITTLTTMSNLKQALRHLNK